MVGTIMNKGISKIDEYVINKVITLRKKKHKEIEKKGKTVGNSNKYSLTQFGASIGLSNQFINKVEKYQRKYSIEQINQIAKLFKVSPQYFFPIKYIEDKEYNKRKGMRKI